MPFPLKIFLSVFLVTLMAMWVMLPTRFDVVAPRMGMPAIVKSGSTIEVGIRSTLPVRQVAWQVSLALRDQLIPLEITQQKTNFNIHLLSVRLPESIDTTGYSLVVSDGDMEVIRPRAIHVVPGFPNRVSIVQMADLPTLGRGDGDRRLQMIIDEINIVNPNLVLMTGDVAYGGTWQQYHRLLAAMEKINAPIVAAPGNHEYEGWAGFLTLLGKPYHSVQYGDLQFLSLNSGHGRDQLTESQFKWLNSELATLDGRTPIVQLHHPMLHRAELRGYLAKHVTDMVQNFKAKRVPIVLSGHWHGDAVYDERGNDRRDSWDFPGAPYVVTTAAGADLREKYSSSPLHHGYRLIQLDSGELISYTYDMDGDGERDAASSIPVGKLRAVPQENGSILLINELYEAFPKTQVLMSVPGNKINLVPDKGQLINRYSHNDRSYYHIEVPLAANSQQRIQLIEPNTRL